MSTVHLIECGDLEGTPVTKLKVGDKLMWNYGAVTTIIALQPKGRGMLIIEQWQSRSGTGELHFATRYRRADVVLLREHNP